MSWGMTLALMLVASVGVAVYVAWPLLVSRNEQQPDRAEDERGSALDELLVEKDATYSAIKELEFDHAMGNLSRQDYQELVSRYEDKAVALLKTIDEVSHEEDGVATALSVAREPERSPRPQGRRGALEDAIEQEVAALRRGRQRSQGRQPAREEDDIEREVAALRRARQGSEVRHPAREEDDIEREAAALRAARRRPVMPPPPSVPSPSVPEPSPAIPCPACGARVKSPSAAFCSRCGASLRAECPSCGQPAERDDAFCSACGSRLPSGDGVGTGKTMIGGPDA